LVGDLLERARGIRPGEQQMLQLRPTPVKPGGNPESRPGICQAVIGGHKQETQTDACPIRDAYPCTWPCRATCPRQQSAGAAALGYQGEVVGSSPSVCLGICNDLYPGGAQARPSEKRAGAQRASCRRTGVMGGVSFGAQTGLDHGIST
jgi:hypothetical protein